MRTTHISMLFAKRQKTESNREQRLRVQGRSPKRDRAAALTGCPALPDRRRRADTTGEQDPDGDLEAIPVDGPAARSGGVAGVVKGTCQN